jgi:hypothetical protein
MISAFLNSEEGICDQIRGTASAATRHRRQTELSVTGCIPHVHDMMKMVVRTSKLSLCANDGHVFEQRKSVVGVGAAVKQTSA